MPPILITVTQKCQSTRSGDLNVNQWVAAFIEQILLWKKKKKKDSPNGMLWDTADLNFAASSLFNGEPI